MMRSVLLAIDSIPSSYLGQPIVHLHFVTKFKSWTLGFSLRVPNRLAGLEDVVLQVDRVRKFGHQCVVQPLLGDATR